MTAKLDVRNLKVLLVSSDAFGLNVIRAALSLANIREISVAYDCESAIKKLQSEDFDVLFCDGDQPQVNSTPFVVAARNTEGVRNPTLPIFLVSAAPGHRQVAEASALGVNAVIARPISAAAVLRKLSHALAVRTEKTGALAQ